MDPAHAEKRMEHMIDHLVPDATPEQKTRLSAIAKSAMADMKPMREQMRAARADSKKLLAQPTIDRAAIEAARVKQMALQDARSKRMSKAMADAAEVLTPAQRAKVAERMAKRGHPMQRRGPR
jgi:Spy/CpxP family protein refolding chaperone